MLRVTRTMVGVIGILLLVLLLSLGTACSSEDKAMLEDTVDELLDDDTVQDGMDGIDDMFDSGPADGHNDFPEITSEPGTNATQGIEYTYLVEATDPDPDDELRYQVENGPQGMNIDERGRFKLRRIAPKAPEKEPARFEDRW